jgi:2-dehydro-3-deoxygluconokinase
MVELSTEQSGAYRLGFAGDTFNTAWNARHLLPADWQVSYASAVGDDPMSDEMIQFAREEGIDSDHIARLPGMTIGLYLISLKDGERSFSYWRGQSAARQLAADPDRLSRALQGRSAIYFSGITLAILDDAGRETLAQALRAARANGATILFDTNLRPRLWASHDDMQAGMRLGGSLADIALPSFDEEAFLFGDSSAEDTVARYRDLGASIVAVKNGGSAGRVWSARSGIASFAPPPASKVVDTTAAGDSFGAAFYAALAAGAAPVDAAEQAAGFAAKVSGDRGALARALFIAPQNA